VYKNGYIQAISFFVRKPSLVHIQRYHQVHDTSSLMSSGILPSSNIITDDISLHLFRPDKGKKNSDERQR
jgi:hypothetical protein